MAQEKLRANRENIDSIIESLFNYTKEDALVAELDPLKADSFLSQELPAINRQADDKSLIKAENSSPPTAH